MLPSALAVKDYVKIKKEHCVSSALKTVNCHRNQMRKCLPSSIRFSSLHPPNGVSPQRPHKDRFRSRFLKVWSWQEIEIVDVIKDFLLLWVLVCLYCLILRNGKFGGLTLELEQPQYFVDGRGTLQAKKGWDTFTLEVPRWLYDYFSLGVFIIH